MIKADNTHQNSQPVSKAFLTLLLSTVLAAYLMDYVSAEQITSSTDGIEVVHQAAGQDLLILSSAA